MYKITIDNSNGISILEVSGDCNCTTITATVPSHWSRDKVLFEDTVAVEFKGRLSVRVKAVTFHNAPFVFFCS